MWCTRAWILSGPETLFIFDLCFFGILFWNWWQESSWPTDFACYRIVTFLVQRLHSYGEAHSWCQRWTHSPMPKLFHHTEPRPHLRMTTGGIIFCVLEQSHLKIVAHFICSQLSKTLRMTGKIDIYMYNHCSIQHLCTIHHV